MNKIATKFMTLSLAVLTLAFVSCEKEEVNEPGGSTGNNNGGGTNNDVYDLTIEVDLGGVFPVTADAVFILEATTFTATVTTKEIAGSPEEHVTEISGTRNGDQLNVQNAVFNVTPPGQNEQIVTITNADITLSGNNLDVTGTMEVDFQDGNPPLPGTFEGTGTK